MVSILNSIGDLKLRAFAAILLVCLLGTTIPVFRTSGETGEAGPVIDEIYHKFLADPSAQIPPLETGEVDHIYYLAINTIEDVQRLKAENFTVFTDGDARIGILLYNCRRGAQMDVRFRRALAYLNPSEEVVQTVLGPRYGACLTYLAPAWGDWVNYDIEVFDFNPTLAASMLDDAGYLYNATLGRRTYPNGTALPDIEVMIPFEVPGLKEIAIRWAERMNEIKVPAKRVDVDITTYFTKILYTNEYDMTYFPGVSETGPASFYDNLHSSRDFPGGTQLGGIHNETIDQLCETLDTTLDSNTALQTCLELQKVLSEQVPYVPSHSGLQIHAYDPDVMSLMSGKVSGFLEFLNLQARWRNGNNPDTGTNILRTGMPWQPPTLNPFVETSGFALIYLNYICDGGQYSGLTVENPFTRYRQPWAAKEWSVEPWADTGKGVSSGMKMTFLLRDDVYWHDGVKATGEDVKFSLEYQRTHQAPFSINMWQNLVETNVTDVYRVEAYFNKTSLWMLDMVSRMALILPKHIWQDVSDPTTFTPWLEPHPTVSGLTKYIGTGPWILPQNGYVLSEYIRFVANRNYWRKPLPSDVNYDFSVNMVDIAGIAGKFGAKSGEPRYSINADINTDKTINIVDIATVAKDFGKTW